MKCETKNKNKNKNKKKKGSVCVKQNQISSRIRYSYWLLLLKSIIVTKLGKEDQSHFVDVVDVVVVESKEVKFLISRNSIKFFFPSSSFGSFIVFVYTFTKEREREISL